MDPNATLEVIRKLASEIVAGDNNLDNSSDLAEYFEALDEWLSKGGFLPNAWSQLETCEDRNYACCEGRIPAPSNCIVRGRDLNG